MGHECYLEWIEWSRDRVMGLNHQMSSLSCALGEAHYLNRTLLFPNRLCIEAKHERWSSPRQTERYCDGKGTDGRPVRGYSIPTSEIIDLQALSQFVDLMPVLLPRSKGGSPQAPDVPASRTVVVDRTWKSARVGATHPCSASHATLVQRRVSTFWFRPCAYGITDGQKLLRHLHRAVRTRGLQPDSTQYVTHLLRSGIFYSAAIKNAARAVRLRLGPEYVAVHVRRSDKFSSSCDRATFSATECVKMERMTRPAEILRSLSLWLPPRSRLYIGSTEPASFFEPLRGTYELSFASDFAPLLANISNNYALYAVDTLVFFGAVSTVETFEYAHDWLKHACFPAAGLRRKHSAAAGAAAAAGSSEAPKIASAPIRVDCADERGVVAAGIYYGHACADNPPCGARNSLVLGGAMAPEGCGRTLAAPSTTSRATCFER